MQFVFPASFKLLSPTASFVEFYLLVCDDYWAICPEFHLKKVTEMLIKKYADGFKACFICEMLTLKG